MLLFCRGAGELARSCRVSYKMDRHLDPHLVGSMFSWPTQEEVKSSTYTPFDSQSVPSNTANSTDKPSPQETNSRREEPPPSASSQDSRSNGSSAFSKTSYIEEIREKLIRVAKLQSSTQVRGEESEESLKKQLDILWRLAKCPTCLSVARSHAFDCGHYVCERCVLDICPVCGVRSACYRILD